MADITKPIASVTINYEDGTQSQVPYYALVGFDEDTWYNVINAPPTRDAKVKMNNYLVDVSNKIIEAIGM